MPSGLEPQKAMKPEALQPGAGRTRVPGRARGAVPEAIPPGGPTLNDLMQGLRMLEEVIAEGDAVARSVALCLLALLIERFPTRDLRDSAEDMLVNFLADDPVGPDLMATINRLRSGAMRQLH